ncbi:DUF58 domain-containing protein [Lentibacillus cibarius]|uniref:DUF58 domain-containing protein n=1 Tax=Lentibacillus cibarius TaxID=2583219 RepID=A0A549YJG3_9BACI|nr:DUF58 domain-containing protein [Lentibacillus cibarius]TRM12001.1 DUF58 domain-containing protein [Lentibacillus cibarius]
MHTLLSPVLANRLTAFRLISKRVVRGGHKGERRSPRLGSSLEFSDYRLYSPGDDLRQIDWNTYARTQKYYVKRFLDEQELSVSIYLDCTKSMGMKQEKWIRAKEFAAAFAFLALTNSDRLSVVPVASPTDVYPYTKGKAMTKRVLQFIERVSLTDGKEAFGEHLAKNLHQSRKGSLNLIISDFLDDPIDLFAALKKMQARHQQVLLIQVVLPEEVNPDYLGDLQLVDLETAEQRDVAMSPKVINNYKQLFEAHTQSIKSFCRQRGMDLLTCPTSDSLEQSLFSSMMRQGWIGR